MSELEDRYDAGICPHGDDPAVCPPCRRRAGRDASLAKPPPKADGGVFLAAYEGKCETCDQPIAWGQPIQHWSDDTYRHEWCGL